MFYPSFIVVEQQCFMRNYFRTSGRGVYLQSFVRVERREEYYFLSPCFHHTCRARIFPLALPERKESDASMSSLKIENLRPNMQVLFISCFLYNILCEYDGMDTSASFK